MFFLLAQGRGEKLPVVAQEVFPTKHHYPCQVVCRIRLLLVLEGLLPITVMIHLLVDLVLHLLLVLAAAQGELELMVMMVDQVVGVLVLVVILEF
jgi:hypothetical protein